MQPKMTISRAVIYAALILFALYFLFPLYVMLSTSFKDIDQLRTGNLLTPPSHPTFAPWIKAWSQACTGVRCDGMEPFFMNSVRMVIPAVLHLVDHRRVQRLCAHALALPWRGHPVHDAAGGLLHSVPGHPVADGAF